MLVNLCFCPLLWEKVCSRHKNLGTALNQKNMPLESFWAQVLKIPFIKKNVDHSQSGRMKNIYQEINPVKNI